MIYHSILDLIGRTPMVWISCFDLGRCRLALKLENQNPGGSIKDRIGLAMIEAAEREGRLKPGGTIIEATAGNTGLGLALVAARKGYRLLLVIPDKMSHEKVTHLKAMGAEIVMTRSDVGKGHPEYYQDYARRLAAETPGAVYVDQFNNPANPAAHEATTAPEIWKQTGQGVDAIVVGVGSGGTIGGLTRFFSRVKPGLEIVLADPAGSVLKDYVDKGTFGEAGSWLVEGIGEDFIPAQADFALVKKAYAVSDRESFETARTLLKKEGILAGSSTGTLVAAAVRYAREQTTPKTIVTFVCDSGNKYLSKMFNDHWMADQGFIDGPLSGDLRDLIAYRHGKRETVTVGPDDALRTVYARMRLYDVSQVPVLENDRAVGIIDESDLLLALEHSGKDALASKAAEHMSDRLETVPPAASLKEVLALLDRGLTAVVQDGERFYGLITRIDVINWLRRKQ